MKLPKIGAALATVAVAIALYAQTTPAPRNLAPVFPGATVSVIAPDGRVAYARLDSSLQLVADAANGNQLTLRATAPALVDRVIVFKPTVAGTTVTLPTAPVGNSLEISSNGWNLSAPDDYSPGRPGGDIRTQMGATTWRHHQREVSRVKRYLVALALLIAEGALVLWIASAIADAQTTPRAEQITGIRTTSPESAWCPGEPLTRSSPQTVTIGAAWTPAAPCYAHFNLTPPQTIDPISVSTFTAPAVVTLTPGAWQDDLYVYLQAPAFTGAALSRPQRIVVQTTRPTMVQCSNCIVETSGAGQRQFPAFSMPVGLVRVENGQVHPSLDPIINSHQLYIGSNLGVAVRRDGAGMWIELSQAQLQAQAQIAQAQMAIGSIEAARARAMAQQPPATQRMDGLEKQFQTVLSELDEIRLRMPGSKEEIADMRQQIDLARESAMRISEEAMNTNSMLQYEAERRITQMEEEYRRKALRMDTVAKAGAVCQADGPIFGYDGKTPLVCEAGTWRRFKTRK
ncbi:MAG: hypothetical protein IPK75_20440 [Acidobacteria bacterium]|nr:hypothetical protein [Acidobacteriota bacterium]